MLYGRDYQRSLPDDYVEMAQCWACGKEFEADALIDAIDPDYGKVKECAACHAMIETGCTVEEIAAVERKPPKTFTTQEHLDLWGKKGA